MNQFVRMLQARLGSEKATFWVSCMPLAAMLGGKKSKTWPGESPFSAIPAASLLCPLMARISIVREGKGELTRYHCSVAEPDREGFGLEPR